MSYIDGKTPEDTQRLIDAGLLPYSRLYLVAEFGDLAFTLSAYIHYAEMKDGFCRASQETLAKHAGVSTRTLRTHTLQLIQKKAIRSRGVTDGGIPKYQISPKFRKNGETEFFPLPDSAGKLLESRADRRLYAALIYRAYPGNDEIPPRGVDKFAKDTGLTSRQVGKSFKSLQALGLIERSVSANAATTKLLPLTAVRQSVQGEGVAPVHPEGSAPVHPEPVPPVHELSAPVHGVVADKLERELELNKNTIQSEEKNTLIGGLSSTPGTQEHPNSQATSRCKTTADPADDENIRRVVEFLRSERNFDLSKYGSDEQLGILICSAFAKTTNHPASAEGSFSQMRQFVADAQKMGDKLANFCGFIRNKLQKPPQCPQTEDLIFVSDIGAYLRSEKAIQRVRTIWQNAVDADKAEAEKRNSELCLDCGTQPGTFVGPFGKRYCYDAYTQLPCDRRSDIENQKQTERRECWEFFQSGTPTKANSVVLEQVRVELIELYKDKKTWRSRSEHYPEDEIVALSKVFATEDEVAEYAARLRIRTPAVAASAGI